MALSIDVLIVGTFEVVLTLFFGTWLLVPWALLGGDHGEAVARLVDIALQPLGIVVLWLYYAVCESSPWQATPGKLALGLAVTDATGRRIGFTRASGRYFGMFASALTLGVGFLLAGWTSRKQALHDFIAGCCVVRKAGLAAWQRDGEARPETARPVPAATMTGMPGWAIALIVVVGGGFMMIPVLAILAAIAVPAYHGYAVRTEVAEGVKLSERPRALVAEYIGQRGALPGSNADLGLPRPEMIRANYVESIRIADGKVVVTYGNRASTAIHGRHVVLAPQGSSAALHWHCSSPDIRERYLPAQCRR